MGTETAVKKVKLSKKAVRILEKIITIIQADSRKINMGLWTANLQEEGSCGTVGCIAGWVRMLTTREVVVYESHFYTLSKLLFPYKSPVGADEFISRVVYDDEWPLDLRTALKKHNVGTPGYAKVVIRRIRRLIDKGV